MEAQNKTPINPLERAARARRVLFLSRFGAFFFFVALWLGRALFAPYYAFIPCGVLMLLACILHNLKNEDKTCAAAALCNAAACGFAASVYFTVLAIPLPPLVLLAGLTALLVLLVLTYFLSFLPVRAWVSAIVSLLYLTILTALIGFWVTCPLEDPIFALAALSFLFYTFSLIPFMLVRTEEETSADRTVSFWSFSVAVLLVLAVVFALAIVSGDGCDADCCDCGDCRNENGKSKKKKP